MARKTIRLGYGEALNLRENDGGVCLACGDIVEGCVEPDARHYRCSECNAHQVFGIEEAMLMGAIELSEDEEDDFDDDF